MEIIESQNLSYTNQTIKNTAFELCLITATNSKFDGCYFYECVFTSVVNSSMVNCHVDAATKFKNVIDSTLDYKTPEGGSTYTNIGNVSGSNINIGSKINHVQSATTNNKKKWRLF